MKSFCRQFCECSDEGLTTGRVFQPFEEFPETLPAFPNDILFQKISSGEVKGFDAIVCGKFSGMCSSAHPKCKEQRSYE